MSDPHSYETARDAMIESQLRPQGVADPLVIAAMASVPRERFVAAGEQSLAYSDRSVPADEGRSLMPPAALGLLLQALAPAPGERGLVVGAASGYAAAVLENMGVDLSADEASSKPLDLILIDGAVEELPDALVERLAEGGRLAVAISERGVTRLAVGTRTGTAFGLRTIADAAVPLIPGFTRPRSFAF